MNNQEQLNILEIAFTDDRLSMREVALLLILYQFSDKNLRCALNYLALRKYARCSFNSLKKYLLHLEEYGYVTPKKVGNKIEYIQLHLK